MAGIYDVNAAIEKPNLVNSFTQGRAIGQQMQQNALVLQDARQKVEDRNALRSLAPQIIAGDPSALQQGAVLDTEAATKLADVGNNQLLKLRNMVGYIDRAKQTGNQAAVNAALQQAWPYIRQVAPGAPETPPTAFTPEMEQGWEALKAKVAMAGESGETPTGFRQFQMTAQAAGLVPGTPQYQEAANIALGRLGRASSAGYGFELVEGADGRKRLQRANPRTGAVEIYDETTGNFAPVGGAAAINGAPMLESGVPITSRGLLDPTQDFQQLAALPGVQVSSLYRDQKNNTRVGGVANSQHMRGTGGDFVVPAAQRQGFIQRARSMGYEAIDEGDHVHVELPPGAQAANRFGPASPSLVVGRRPEDEAAAVEAAKTQVQLGALPTELGLRTDAAVREAAGKAAAETQADVDAQAGKRTRGALETLSLLDEAEKLLPNATSGRLEAMRDQGAAFFGQSTEGAQATAALNLIAAKLVANVPRFEGPQSNIDVQFYREAAGDLANPNLPVETRMAAARQMRTLQEKYAGRASQPSGAPARVQSAADYDALPSGAQFYAPDGTLRRKR